MRTIGGEETCHQVESVANHQRLRNAALLHPCMRGRVGVGLHDVRTERRVADSFRSWPLSVAVMPAEAGIQLQAYPLPSIGVFVAESIAEL